MNKNSNHIKGKDMLKILRRCIPFFSLILSGCLQPVASVGAGDRPDWLSGEPSSYPNSQYLYATGSASKADQAQDRALGNLVKIFELHLKETSTTTQDVQSHRSGDKEDVTASARIASRVNISTDKMIQGARIAEQWQSPGDLTYYALAVLERGQAGNNIRSEIKKIDDETEVKLQQSQSRQDALQQVGDLQDVLDLQSRRDSLQKTLKIIDLQGKGIPPRWNRAELDEKLDSAMRAMRMSADVTRDDVGELGQMLQAAMAAAGFSNQSAGGYILSAALASGDVLQRQGWYWLRGTLTLRLTAADGTVLGNRSWPLKVSALQQQQLNSRMRMEVDKKLKQELKASVLGFANGG
jgi:hypothetical protein